MEFCQSHNNATMGRVGGSSKEKRMHSITDDEDDDEKMNGESYLSKCTIQSK